MNEPIHIRARKFLEEFFNDEELATFCFDYFPQVYNNFARGMTKNEKVLDLVAHSQRRERFDELLAALERERPTSYPDHFAEQPHLIDPEPQTPKTIERNPRQIFISHAHQDAEFAQRLVVDLQANGWKTWMAPADIRPGEKWVEAINRGLSESGVLALLLTPDAVASRWVQTETNVAIAMEHRGQLQFVPLSLKPTAVPPLWEAYQWISFTMSYESGLQMLLDRLSSKHFDDNQKRPFNLDEVIKEFSSSEVANDPFPIDFTIPISKMISKYKYGHDDYDDSFTIENAEGEFLGECGVEISYSLGDSLPKKVAAIEVWLFDKIEIRTKTKVILSDFAFFDDKIRKKIRPKGELFLARQGEIIVLETKGIIVNAEIKAVEYMDLGRQLPHHSIFKSFYIELSVGEIAK